MIPTKHITCTRPHNLQQPPSSKTSHDKPKVFMHTHGLAMLIEDMASRMYLTCTSQSHMGLPS